jgi:hypothetical protein
MSYSPYNLNAARGPKSETKRVILIVIASMIGFVLLVLFLALALSLPRLLSSRRAANEASAVATIRTIATAEETYYSVHRVYGTGQELAAGGFVDARMGGVVVCSAACVCSPWCLMSATWSMTNYGSGCGALLIEKLGGY